MSLKTIAIVIGVSRTQKSDIEVLSAARADAILFAQSLRSWGVQSEDIYFFLDEVATLEQIEGCLTKLKNREESFKLLFYFCGHGLRDQSEEPKSYLLLYDGKFGLDGLVRKINELNALSIYLFIDACHLRINQWINPEIKREIERKENLRKTFFCILASGIEQSFEDIEGGYGYFTRALLKGLSEARRGDNSPTALLESLCKEHASQGLPFPEMYNIETLRIDFFPEFSEKRGGLEEIQDALIYHPEKILCIEKSSVGFYFDPAPYFFYYEKAPISVDHLPSEGVVFLELSPKTDIDSLAQLIESLLAKEGRFVLIYEQPFCSQLRPGLKEKVKEVSSATAPTVAEEGLNRAIAAVAACGSYVDESLFCRIYELQPQLLDRLKSTGLLLFSEDGWTPHDTLLDLAETKFFCLDGDRAIEYWRQQMQSSPADRQVARSFLLTVKCFGHRKEIEEDVARAAKLLGPISARRTKFIRAVRWVGLIAVVFLAVFIGNFAKGQESSFTFLPRALNDFVGREEVLKGLKNSLFKNNELSVVALWGPGGMGKSEAAIYFANSNLRKFSLVYWINAGSKEVCQQSYIDLAKQLNISIDSKTSFEKVRSKVHSTLENTKFSKPWLLIYDNADHALEIPQRGNGKVLVTTRDKTEWEAFECVELTPFSQANARQLCEKVMRLKLTKELETLAKELDYYPLALSQALHYVKESPCFSLEEYLAALEENKEILLTQPSKAGRYPKNLFNVWKVSAEAIKSEQPKAYEWLELCAYFHPDKIPVHWLETWLLTEEEASLKEAKFRADQILRLLTNQGHIRQSRDKKTFSLHRLKQEVIKGSEVKKGGKQRALHFLCNLVKNYEMIDTLDWHCDRWNELLIWEANAAWWLEKNRENKTLANDLALVLNVRGNIETIIKGRCREGAVFYERALTVANRSSATLRGVYALINQAQCAFLLGESVRSVELCEQALSKVGRARTKEKARCLLCLGTTYNYQGYPKKAIQLVEEAVSIYQVLGDPKLLAELCEGTKLLGNFWTFAGDPIKAIEYSLQALEYNRALFGQKENIQRSYTLINLGRALRQINENDLALKSHLEAHRIEKKLFFSEMFFPLISLKEIAIDYCAKGNYKTSRRYTEKALRIAEELWDPNYLRTTRIQLTINLGNIALGMGNAHKALEYYQQAHERFGSVLKEGISYLYVEVYGSLAQAYSKLNRTDIALEFLEKGGELHRAFALEMPIRSLSFNRGNEECREAMYEVSSEKREKLKESCARQLGFSSSI